MLRISEISDLETAKQVATLLEVENTRLHKTLKEMTHELASLRGEDGDKQLKMEVLKLSEQMALMQHRLFGAKSEKRVIEKTSPLPVREAGKGHGVRRQEQLPIETVLWELPDAERGCRACGGTLEVFQEAYEGSEEIDIVERRFVLKHHLRKKYRCRCNANVVTAPGPMKLVPKGRYSIDFAVETVIAKYLDHTPLERQVRIMKREGLIIDSQTLWDQCNALARHLSPTYEALCDELLAEPVILCDETPWYLLVSRPSERWYVWCMAAERGAYYWIQPSRSARSEENPLRDYQGVIVADGFRSYEALAKSIPGITIANCWAHVRRKFVEAEKFYPDDCQVILDLIGELFAIERAARDGPPKERAKLRKDRSSPVVKDIREWARVQHTLPEGALGKAVSYMVGLWPGLVRFLDDARIPIHTNQVERQLRSPVVGRKNLSGPSPGVGPKLPRSSTACSRPPSFAGLARAPICARRRRPPSRRRGRSRCLDT